ncbi:MAG: hypothetical protein ABL912_02040 [Novosphingobium sp.]
MSIAPAGLILIETGARPRRVTELYNVEDDTFELWWRNAIVVRVTRAQVAAGISVRVDWNQVRKSRLEAK